MNADIAWAAGLFEGEGCISFNDKHRRMPKLQVFTTDLDVLERFHQVVGCGEIHNSGHARVKAGHKRGWSWVVHGLPAWTLYQQLRPYLGQRRRERGDEVFANLSLLGPGGRKRIDAYETDTVKACAHCGEVKPLEQFNFQGARGRGSYCKACHALRHRAYWERNKDTIRARNRESMRRRRAV